MYRTYSLYFVVTDVYNSAYVCVSVCVCLSFSHCDCLSVCLFACLYLFDCMSVSVSLCLCVCLFVCISVIVLVSAHLTACLSVYLPVLWLLFSHSERWILQLGCVKHCHGSVLLIVRVTNRMVLLFLSHSLAFSYLTFSWNQNVLSQCAKGRIILLMLSEVVCQYGLLFGQMDTTFPPSVRSPVQRLLCVCLSITEEDLNDQNTDMKTGLDTVEITISTLDSCAFSDILFCFRNSTRVPYTDRMTDFTVQRKGTRW